MTQQAIVRIVEASLGGDAQVHLVLSRVSDPDKLRSAWASSGATLERVGDRIHATTTVEALARAAGRALDRDEALALDGILRQAVTAWGGDAPAVKARGHVLPTDKRPLIMGIVNVTPDSFADGGLLYPDGHPSRAIDHGRELVAAGADIIDIGGESTRPGAEEVPAEEELSRVMPVVRALVSDGACVSIDTRKAEVAEQALGQGAAIVNDVGAGSDADLVGLAGKAGAAYVLMHSRSTPADMTAHTEYDDVVAGVYEFLRDGITRCRQAGLPSDRIIVDPGIGFAKTADQSLSLLRAVRQFRCLGQPVLIGASRKSFLTAATDAEDVKDRLPGSLAAATLATASGAALVRVHDVGQTIQAVRTSRAITTGRTDWPPIVS